MGVVDGLLILLYFVVVLGLGFWYRRRAAADLESYFLGGKNIHWLPLAMSGSVSNFDITGTMWIVSILFLLGFKSMWHHWMWGFLMGAFFMAYMGKWVRRSGVMTAAEWMKTRFGEAAGGRLARTAYALMAVLTLSSFVGYAFQGIGKFASVYVPLERWGRAFPIPFVRDLLVQNEPEVLAVLIIGITTLYVLLGGLYGVVLTDVIQTVILSLSGLLIAFIAWKQMTPDRLAALPEGFTSLRVPWKLPEFAGTENAQFQLFGALVIIWVVKGLLMNAGGPAQMYDFQRFLAARNDRDAAKIGAGWSFFLVVRWAMVTGITLLAMTGAAGVTDAEKVMPIVLRDYLPLGLRGLVIAGLLAAFMSTFSSTVNSGASFIVRDIWQPFFRPKATEPESIRFSFNATVLVVLIGIIIGLQGRSIASIWNWMMVALGGGVIIPNVLRWYWWRMNGWGYALGTLGGMALSLLALFFPSIPQTVLFPAIVGASLLISVLVSVMTPPVDREVLDGFFSQVRPFGLWGPVRRGLSDFSKNQEPESAGRGEGPLRAVVNVLLGMAAVLGLYLAPMYLVGHWYGRAAGCFVLFLFSAVCLKFTWYDYLPPPGSSRGSRGNE